ncbi:hypothetical protein NQ063_13805, partial [Escherichia coli]|uniref:hypothetical protein n=1 Tax=Escherichia coli TaxID=562 RepID=UPI0023F7029B
CHRRLACEPGGCSAPVAGYSACLTSFTSSIRFSLHAYYGSHCTLTDIRWIGLFQSGQGGQL